MLRGCLRVRALDNVRNGKQAKLKHVEPNRKDRNEKRWVLRIGQKGLTLTDPLHGKVINVAICAHAFVCAFVCHRVRSYLL